MKRLEENMQVNGQNYKLIKRSHKIVMYSINCGRRYEVTRIYILPKSYNPYWLSHSPEWEVISANGRQFNMDGSRYFFKEEDALLYFDKLNKALEGKTENKVTI